MNSEQRKFINNAFEQHEKLLDWEYYFISDLTMLDALSDKPEGYELSQKQNALLNRIQGKLD